MGKEDTKTRLLEEGSALILERGYAATGIQDILRAAGVPKGSFYHHFRSKEDFGLQVLDRYGEAAYRLLDERLSDESHPPIERIRLFFQDVFIDWESKSCRYGCLLGKLGQELAEINTTYRLTIAAIFERWSLRIAACLSEAQARGELDASINPAIMASQLVDGFEGAAMRMKLLQTTEPLQGFLDVYFDRLLAA